MFGFGSSQKRHGISIAKAEAKRKELLARRDQLLEYAAEHERRGSPNAASFLDKAIAAEEEAKQYAI